MPEPVEPVETTEHIQTEEPKDTLQGAGSEPVAPKKKSWLARMTPLQRTLLGLAIIAVMVACAFYAPPEGDAENTTGDPGIVLPVTTTNMIASKTIHRTLQYHGLQMTILDVKLANKFSNDKETRGNYTLRVEVNVDNKGQAPIGVPYAKLVRLLPAHGSAIPTKYISVKPDAMPGSTQNNCFFDFPLTQSAPISSFTLQLDQNTMIPLGS